MSFEFRVTSFEAQVTNRDAMHRRSTTDTLAARASRRTTHRGVTLIELLVTITIVSILSAAFLGTSQLAMESSREARTKSTVSKIHGLLMEKWNEYATRRVDIHPEIIRQIRERLLPANLAPADIPRQRRLFGLALADLRLLASRELMKLEMPDRWADIVMEDLPDSNPTSVAFGYQSVLSSIPAVTQVYRRRFLALDKGVSGETIVENQGAECLYMIIMLTTADGEARTLFSEYDIGDTDGDGAPEFLDGWRRPIEFVRWPAGFYEQSDLMEGPGVLDPDTNRLVSSDHDPADMFRRDSIGITQPLLRAYQTNLSNTVTPPLGRPEVYELMRQIRDRNSTIRPVLELSSGDRVSVGAFRLLPLVYSTGPDGEGDINTDVNGSQFVRSQLDPYAIDQSEPIFEIGRPDDVNADGDDNSIDNIHNHLQDNR